MGEKIKYLGHHSDTEGLHTMNSKVDTISMVLQPWNAQELQVYSTTMVIFYLT